MMRGVIVMMYGQSRDDEHGHQCVDDVYLVFVILCWCLRDDAGDV